MNKQIKRDKANLNNCRWEGMTSSIQHIGNQWRGDDGYPVYNKSSASEYARTRADSWGAQPPITRHQDMYGTAPPRSKSDNPGPKRAHPAPPIHNGTMFNTLGRSRRRSRDEPDRGGGGGGGGTLPGRGRQYYDTRTNPKHRAEDEEARNRETAFPPRDVYFDKVRNRGDVRDAEFYNATSRQHDSRQHDARQQQAPDNRKYHTLQPRDVKEYKKYVEYEQSQRSSKPNKVPEDLYKAVQQKTPNEHVFVEYGKETRRVVVGRLPVALSSLLDGIVSAFSDTLTTDMVPLKALYIEDPQSKIFYQLDDPNDVVKGSHLRVNEEFTLVTIDRGSSQSLEDLNNSSNSSLDSGGYVIPVTVNNNLNNQNLNDKPPIIKRHGKSRLSLVEEKLSQITHEFNTIALKSDTGSTHSAVSSQTDFGVQYGKSLPAPNKQLHSVIRSLHQNLLDTRNELMVLKRKELERKGEMDEIVAETAAQISRHIECAMPKGIRRKRMQTDKLEEEYRKISESTYTNIKDLEVTVEVLKTDVVKRKVKLDPLQLESMERELQQYTSQISHMNSTFGDLKEWLKDVMAEELEIIVNEEQFLQDEEPMLEEGTDKCEELAKLMQTLKKVAIMQRNKGSTQLEIYTTCDEHDILEERNSVIQAISSLVPNHDERLQSIQATEEFRTAQKKFVKSEAEQVKLEIQQTSRNLRKTNAFEDLERQRAEALKNLFNANPPPHKFGRKVSEPEFRNAVQQPAFRRASLNKCKSMSNIAHVQDHNDSNSDEYDSESESTELSRNSSIKRSRSFSSKEKHNTSEDEKSKKRTMFAGFFSKKSKSKQEDVKKEVEVSSDSNTGDVVVVDTAKIKKNSGGDKYVHYENGPPSPAMVRSNTMDPPVKRNSKTKNSKTARQTSLSVPDQRNDLKSRNKKSKNR